MVAAKAGRSQPRLLNSSSIIQIAPPPPNPSPRLLVLPPARLSPPPWSHVGCPTPYILSPSLAPDHLPPGLPSPAPPSLPVTTPRWPSEPPGVTSSVLSQAAGRLRGPWMGAVLCPGKAGTSRTLQCLCVGKASATALPLLDWAVQTSFLPSESFPHPLRRLPCS